MSGWYSRPQEIEYRDGSKGIEYHLVFETTDRTLKDRVEKFYQSIMDELEDRKKN